MNVTVMKLDNQGLQNKTLYYLKINYQETSEMINVGEKTYNKILKLCQQEDMNQEPIITTQEQDGQVKQSESTETPANKSQNTTQKLTTSKLKP